MKLSWILGHIWMAPVTAFGLLTALFGWCSFEGVGYDGALYFLAKRGGLCSKWFTRYRFAAYTSGGVIVFAKPEYRDMILIKKHEHRHVRQTMMLGVLMPIAYGVSSLLAVTQGLPAYESNWFEADANAHDSKPEWP